MRLSKTSQPAKSASIEKTMVASAKKSGDLSQAKEEGPAAFAHPAGPAHDFGKLPLFPTVSGRIQPKLMINTPGDAYEQEADRMAERVMRMPLTQHHASPLAVGRSGGMLQRKCAKCGTEVGPENEEQLMRKADGSFRFDSLPEPDTLQRKCATCEEEEEKEGSLMRKAENGGGFMASPKLTSQLNGSKGGGFPLPQNSKSLMEGAFGTDFSGVRVHTGARATEMSRGIQARAFTHGSDIYFNQGTYAPESGEGRRLLAHELTHTVQQGGKGIKRKTTETTSQQEAEPTRFIVTDDATPAPGQMTKSEFLQQLNDSVCTTVDQELEGTPYSSDNCPYIRAIFARHAGSSPAQIEQLAARYESATASAQSADDLIQLILGRVRTAVGQWKQRGSLDDVPEDVSSMLSGGMAGSPDAATGGGAAVQFNARPGGAYSSQSPHAVMQSLGKGGPLDSSTRSRMEGAFGTSFSGVQVHTDSHAASLAGGMNARAFAVGNHIAFGSGEHQPGTLVGDALIAHELAHTIQQDMAQKSTGIDQNNRYDDLEKDADNTSIHIIGQLIGVPKSAISKIARTTKSRLKSGLRLQACDPRKAPSKVVVKNPFEEPAAVKDAVGASAALDTYKVLPEAERLADVTTANKKTLISVLRTISPTDQVGKYRDQIREITRWIEESETRSSAKMTDDQIATEQAKYMEQESKAAAAAAKAAAAPAGTPPAPPTPAEISAESKKKVESTSIAPPSPINAWDALASIPGEQAKWTKRGNDAIAKVVSHIQKNHPELGVTAANFNLDFHAIAARGATVIAAGSPAQVGFTFVSTAELNPAYVVDIVVHEIYGHPEYGVYGTEYHLALYDKAAPKVSGYTKPAGSARTTEIDSYAYQETEIYSFLRSMPYRTAATAADAPKVPNLDTQRIVNVRVGLLKQNWAPSLIIPIVRGLRARFLADPRITPAAIAIFDKAVDANFAPATADLIKK